MARSLRRRARLGSTCRQCVFRMGPVFVIGLLVGMPLNAGAQSVDELIAEAVHRLPDQQKDQVTVVAYQSDGDRKILRQGSGMICEPDGSGPGIRIRCYDEEFVPRLDEVARLSAQGLSSVRIGGRIRAALRAGALANATTGALMQYWSGPDADHIRLLTAIWVPGATGVSTSLPVEPSQDKAWLMCPGSPTAHIMIGSEPYGFPEDLWRQCIGTAAR